MVRNSVMARALLAIACTTTASAEERAHRSFEFTYEARVIDLPEGARTIDLWLPIPRDSEHQRVDFDESALPAGASIGTEATFANRVFHRRFTFPLEDAIGAKLTFKMVRDEIVIDEAKKLGGPVELNPLGKYARYLGPSKMVPIEGRLSDIALDLGLADAPPLDAGRRIYDYVVDLMRYDKTNPGWGRGDALWACDSRTGNCSDFHSVFIGLSRARQTPAFFEIGFPLPPDQTQGEIGGYHCWAWFQVEGVGWIPVDASEADKHPEMREYYFGALTADRVAFSRGRDLTLVPPQKGPPLNFFIYPYVEIDGKPHEGVEKKFSFRDF